MNVVLGVGGGIAAYKSAELARALMERGLRVQVVMTDAAREFITPLTFASLTGRKVITGLFASGSSEETLSSAVEHIAVAQDNEVLVIAPATADLMAHLAHGLADDFLTTMYLAFTGRVVLAPAMNTNMWNHPATQENLETLRQRGHVIVEPEEGLLACGMTGPGTSGRARQNRRCGRGIKFRHRAIWKARPFSLPPGPRRSRSTRCAIISNRSSGKMGYALAEAAAQRGAEVILVSGPVQLPEPRGVRVLHVRTALEMHDAVMAHLSEATIIVKAAAVADYHLAQVPRHKIKKTAMRMSLDLDPTLDILAELGRKKGDRLLIGFAAETENLIESARQKLESKNCDMMVANLVNQEGYRL